MKKNDNLNIKILVPTYKPYIMPDDKELYMPVQVGVDEVEERLGCQGDNTGDNISYKHRYYSELSAIYWAWKNLDCDYIGLCHHRRFFVSRKIKPAIHKQHEKILCKKEIITLLKKCPVIMSKRRRYYIETKESQFRHAHDGKALDVCKEVIGEKYPDCIPAYERVMKRTWQHNYNMFIMPKFLMNEYSEWLFSILFEMENRLKLEEYTDPYQIRVLGYVGERLMDVWLEYRQINYQEVPIVMIEKQDWIKKGFNFIKRKFTHELRKSSD